MCLLFGTHASSGLCVFAGNRHEPHKILMRTTAPEGGIMPDIRSIVLTSILLALLAGGARIVATMGGGPDWGMIGNDAVNSRSQPLEHTIDPANAWRLAVKWVATTTGDV